MLENALSEKGEMARTEDNELKRWCLRKGVSGVMLEFRSKKEHVFEKAKLLKVCEGVSVDPMPCEGS